MHFRPDRNDLMIYLVFNVVPSRCLPFFQMLKQIEDEQIAQRCYSEMLEEEERLSGSGTYNQTEMWHAG